MVTESDDVFGAEPDPDRYQLVQELASGGMATVYLARTRGPGEAQRIVAIKRIHRHLAREQAFLEMFFDEARIATRISHPNVCAVFDFGRAGGACYIAMEYVLGETLMELIHVIARDRELRESLRWQVYVATIVAGACSGLHAVHEVTDENGRPMHVVHRDVSPSNIFVTYEGGVKVVDFGIAYAQEKVHRTRTGTLKGSLGYMAPELMDGDPRDVDRRADIWGLGVCLWELLVGGLLFRGHNDAATMLNVMQRPVPSLQSFTPVPAELDAIVGRALDRDRTGRYPTAHALGSDLRSWIARTGERVGKAEISDFMQMRFAPQYARKLDVMEEAHTASGAVALEVMSEDQVTTVLPIRALSGRRSESADLILHPLPAEPPPAFPLPVPPGPAPRGRRWGTFLVVFTGALLAVAVTALVLSYRQDDPASSTLAVTVETSAPPPATPPGAPSVVEPAVEPPAAPVEPAVADPPEEPKVDDRPARSAKRKRSAAHKEPRHRAQDEARRPAPSTDEVEEDPPAAPEPVDPEPPVAAPDPPRADPRPVEPKRPDPAPPKRSGPLAATVKVSSLTVQGSLVNSMVSRGIERVEASLRACYREAAVAAGKNARGVVRVTLSINEAGQVDRATASGGPLPGLDACVQRAALKIRAVTAPDVGGATAKFDLKFTPQGE